MEIGEAIENAIQTAKDALREGAGLGKPHRVRHRDHRQRPHGAS